MVSGWLRKKREMRRVVLSLVAGAAIAGGSMAWAQSAKTMLVEPPAPLLPQKGGGLGSAA